MTQINKLIDSKPSTQSLRVAFKYTLDEYVLEIFDPITFKEEILQEKISIYHLTQNNSLSLSSSQQKNTLSTQILNEQMLTDLIVHCISLVKKRFSFTVNDCFYFVDCNENKQQQIIDIIKKILNNMSCKTKIMTLKQYVDDLFLYFNNFEFKVTFPNEKEKVVDEGLFNHWKTSYYSYSFNRFR